MEWQTIRQRYILNCGRFEYFLRIDGRISRNLVNIGARMPQMVSARSTVREVPSSIPRDFTWLFRILSVQCGL